MADKNWINMVGMVIFICNANLIYKTKIVDNLPTCILQILNFTFFFFYHIKKNVIIVTYCIS